MCLFNCCKHLCKKLMKCICCCGPCGRSEPCDSIHSHFYKKKVPADPVREVEPVQKADSISVNTMTESVDTSTTSTTSTNVSNMSDTTTNTITTKNTPTIDDDIDLNKTCVLYLDNLNEQPESTNIADSPKIIMHQDSIDTSDDSDYSNAKKKH